MNLKNKFVRMVVTSSVIDIPTDDHHVSSKGRVYDPHYVIKGHTAVSKALIGPRDQLLMLRGILPELFMT